VVSSYVYWWVAVSTLPRTEQQNWCCVGLARTLNPRAPQMKFSQTVLEGNTAKVFTKLYIIRQKTSVDSSYYISEYSRNLHSVAQRLTSTDISATTLLSSSRDGWCQQDGARAHIKDHNQLVTLHSAGRLASKFARFVSDWKRLVRYGCSCLCQPRAADTDGTRTSSSEILEINFVWPLCKISSIWTRDRLKKQRRHCSVLKLSLRIVLK